MNWLTVIKFNVLLDLLLKMATKGSHLTFEIFGFNDLSSLYPHFLAAFMFHQWKYGQYKGNGVSLTRYLVGRLSEININIVSDE